VEKATTSAADFTLQSTASSDQIKFLSLSIPHSAALETAATYRSRTPTKVAHIGSRRCGRGYLSNITNLSPTSSSAYRQTPLAQQWGSWTECFYCCQSQTPHGMPLLVVLQQKLYSSSTVSLRNSCIQTARLVITQGPLYAKVQLSPTVTRVCLRHC
jgi:hypothetical protein